jgi:hypothetical protein
VGRLSIGDVRWQPVADIRPARSTDVFALTAILVAQHARSRYVGICEVDQGYTRQLLARSIQRHGGSYDGATLVNVVERDGCVVAFMMGALQRVYQIGDRLEAYDVFLARNPNADAHGLYASQLIREYVRWAKGCEKVVDINLSHTDVTPESEGIGSLYELLGFVRHGGLYRLGVSET